MRKALYSRSGHRSAAVDSPAAPVAETRVSRWRNLYKRRNALIAFAAGAALAAFFATALTPAPQHITQDDVDAAVAKALETRPPPSPATRAWQAVRGSIVRVRAIGDGLENDEYAERAQGTGVVIRDNGIILTSLHVITGASRIRVEFFDGLEAEALLVTSQPENDLAVLRAQSVPDDLQAATLASAKKLVEGEHVTAIGFPFGIGPSVSAGVVSGLGREYSSPAGGAMLRELIQFDAAVNPGSSGGPLVNAAGEVVGIVTAMLSRSEAGSFSGIAFAVPIQNAAAAAGLPPF